MSQSSINTILDRISIAPINLPIAVFHVPGKKYKKFDAVFVHTVATQRMLKTNADNLIGIFSELSLNEARKILSGWE